jgi:hypothetical protein
MYRYIFDSVLRLRFHCLCLPILLLEQPHCPDPPCHELWELRVIIPVWEPIPIREPLFIKHNDELSICTSAATSAAAIGSTVPDKLSNANTTDICLFIWTKPSSDA